MRPASAAPFLVTALLLAATARAQSAPPEAPRQDELDLQANANFVQGSGARAFGMGGAFLARPDDSTAASWNPAGLSYLKEPELSFVMLDAGFDGRRQPVRDCRAKPSDPAAPCGIETDRRDGRYPDFAALTLPWELRAASGAIQVSYQRVLPFQSERTITLEPAPGDAPRPETRTIETRGGFDIFALGAGARVSRKLRVGATLNRWFNGFDQTRLRPDLVVPSRQESDLTLSAWNVHLGVIVSPWESLNLGLVFKTGFTARASLDRVRYDTFERENEAGELVERTLFNAYSRDDVKIVLPRALGFGASWRPQQDLTLSVDYTRTNWSSGRIRNFFTLARASPFGRPLDNPGPDPLTSGDFCGVYPPGTPPPANACPPALPYPTLGAEQKDTGQIRAGLEYVIGVGRLKLPIRAGYFRDSQFFPSQEGDAPTFDGWSAGTGLILSDLLLDVAYVHESGNYTDGSGVDNDVKFQKLYASIIYRLPRPR